jgi:2-(1,2-epoxy-1,2-dihydrophenyl)acetyl-CoA isomerase
MTAFAAEHVRLALDGPVATITLDRPDRLNAFAGSMRDDLQHAIRAASEHGTTRAIVLTGAGGGFCAGADVGVMEHLMEAGDEDTFTGFVDAGMRVVHAIREAAQPVIAALNGVAAGAGASLAIACDLRIASDRARIGFSFNRVGLHPDWGATYTLPRLVGTGRATELLISARMVEMEEAERIGLVHRVVAHDRLTNAALQWAREIATRAPVALREIKRTVASAFEGDLDQQMASERAAQIRCFASRDAREGIAAFREKRDAAFDGR